MAPTPRLKQIESALCSISADQREFQNPSVALEQYPTSPHLCACVVQLASSEQFDDLGEGRSVLDLGVGTGMLSMGAALVGTSTIYCVDCDEGALLQARENVEELLGDEYGGGDDDDDYDDEEDGSSRPKVEFILAKVQMKKGNVEVHQKKSLKGGDGRGRGRGRSRGRGGRGGKGSQPAEKTKARLIHNGVDGTDGIPLRDNFVDTVLTNPPFGTKSDNQGIDLQFLLTATRLARRAVYSFHKRSTRPFLLKSIREWGHEGSVVAEMSFDVKQMYQFHKLKTKDIEVDLIRIEIRSNDNYETTPENDVNAELHNGS